jgi:hypothetical protein
VNARRADRGSPHAGSVLVEVRAFPFHGSGRVSREIPVAIAWAGPLDTGAAPARVPPPRAHGQWSPRDRSSAPAMKAARSQRLSSLRRPALPVGCRGASSMDPYLAFRPARCRRCRAAHSYA